MRKIAVAFVAAQLLVLICFAQCFAQTEKSSATSDQDLVSRALEGQEMIFARRYDDALGIFNAIKRDYPESPTGHFGTLATLEIMMLEREDFHMEKEFLAASKEGHAVVEKTLQKYDPDKWDLFTAGSLLGIEGFFKARKGKWLESYSAGTKSRQIFKRVKDMDPSFIDADFGLGMYIYWRSVFAKDLWFLKMFPDRRAEGLAIVKNVADNGKFAKELARVNLGVMYFEDGKYDDAHVVFSDFIARFPNNVILRTMDGRVEIARKHYDQALAQFRAALKVDSSLKKPHYFIGAILVLKGEPADFAEAESELKSFIAMEAGKYWPSYAHYWLGRLYEMQGRKDLAQKEYEESYKLNNKIKEAVQRAHSMGGGVHTSG